MTVIAATISLYGSVPEDGASFELDAGIMHISSVNIKDHRLSYALVSIAK